MKKEEDLKEEVLRQRELTRLIKEEHANELKKNLAVFVNLNLEEKILRSELVERQTELKQKEKMLKLSNVVH
jgi:hypothetical protein